MAELEESQPLIPQYSIRWLLAVTAGCAVVFSVLGLAARGDRWAMGVSIGVGSLVVLMGVYAMMFGVVWVFSLWADRKRRRAVGGCPFAMPSSEERRADHQEEALDTVILE